MSLMGLLKGFCFGPPTFSLYTKYHWLITFSTTAMQMTLKYCIPCLWISENLVTKLLVDVHLFCRFIPIHIIRRILPFLTQKMVQVLQFLVISCLDYCNMLLADVCECQPTTTVQPERQVFSHYSVNIFAALLWLHIDSTHLTINSVVLWIRDDSDQTRCCRQTVGFPIHFNRVG